MLDKAVWDQDVPVPPSAISYVDDAILKSQLHVFLWQSLTGFPVMTFPLLVAQPIRSS